MVDAAHPLFVLNSILVICLLHLKLLRMVRCLNRIADIGRQIDASKAGHNGRHTYRIDNHYVFRHKKKDCRNRHKGRKQQNIHNYPHLRCQTRRNLPQVLSQKTPRRNPEQQPNQQRNHMNAGACQIVLISPTVLCRTSRRICQRKENFFAGFLHQIIDCYHRRAKDQHRSHLLNHLSDMKHKKIKEKSPHCAQKTIWVIGVNDGGCKNINHTNPRNAQKPVPPHWQKGANHAQKDKYIAISQQITANLHKTNHSKSPQYSASCSINCLRLGWLIGIVSPVTSVISSLLTPFTKNRFTI